MLCIYTNLDSLRLEELKNKGKTNRFIIYYLEDTYSIIYITNIKDFLVTKILYSIYLHTLFKWHRSLGSWSFNEKIIYILNADIFPFAARWKMKAHGDQSLQSLSQTDDKIILSRGMRARKINRRSGRKNRSQPGGKKMVNWRCVDTGNYFPVL